MEKAREEVPPVENTVIYFRPGGIQDDEEHQAACKFFKVTTSRMSIPKGSLVIPRYSALPYYQELEEDVNIAGGQLINSFLQHQFVADILRWYPLLEDLTPKTWTGWGELPKDKQYVVKGRCNSRKQHWDSQMFAEDITAVRYVAQKLLDDDLIREQGIVVREFVPLRRLGEGINKMPISNEWRFFVLDGQLLSSGFYWASHPELEPRESFPGATGFVREVVRRVGDRIRFFVVDIAEKADGTGWIVIELNDGQSSGLPLMDPVTFYQGLREALG